MSLLQAGQIYLITELSSLGGDTLSSVMSSICQQMFLAHGPRDVDVEKHVHEALYPDILIGNALGVDHAFRGSARWGPTHGFR